VGSLEDRIDWDLIAQIADAFPQGSVVLLGRPPASAPRQAWYRAYTRATARANVHLLGWKDQARIGPYTAAFDVCLIPYASEHPFNRVACPTKVMDYMATSRPVVSTALPECRLYHDLFDIADTREQFISAIRRLLDRQSDDGRAALRWHRARNSTWERTSARLLEMLTDQFPGRTHGS
jgi:hypothetical protein